MNVFEIVKENVTARQAAEAYGLKVGRTGMACCPFHSDKSPSMKPVSYTHLMAKSMIRFSIGQEAIMIPFKVL